ncbi:hypothetical protein [Jiella avicenniae]|uniref:Uncharacterized protein n=1 Tax=Jiella avicenniae TaxID=2907202 RepID=A0A9X1P2F3_9HYPH|nr:hypothetical protein [Jiella avicenniae]MCE7029822.1 hypothetical protein [Jiella avicenniae]
MRLMAFAAASLVLSAALSGCVSASGDIAEVMNPEDPADDAHCQSLLIRPGELVYAQCRLALRKTYLNDYNARKAVLAQRYGPVTGTLDAALRADAFCNYDESVKQVTSGLSDDVVASTAYQNCANTREELGAAFVAATGQPAEALVEAERGMVLDQNRAAIREAHVVIKGPPGSVLTTEAEVAERGGMAPAVPAEILPPAPLSR